MRGGGQWDNQNSQLAKFARVTSCTHPRKHLLKCQMHTWLLTSHQDRIWKLWFFDFRLREEVPDACRIFIFYWNVPVDCRSIWHDLPSSVYITQYDTLYFIHDSINLSRRCQETRMSMWVFFRFFSGPEGEGGGHPGGKSRFCCDFGESLVGWKFQLGYTPENYQLEPFGKGNAYTCTPNFAVPCEFLGIL